MVALGRSAMVTTAIHTSTLLTKVTVLPRAAVASASRKMRVPYELKHGQSRRFHKLPSGLDMEVIFQERCDAFRTTKPPLVFVHGSFHAAWCWAEHWLPYFSQHGYDCYALSLLGQGESDSPSGAVAGTLQTHASDVADFIEKEIQLPPVLLGHSFGGLIVQYYLGDRECSLPHLAGAVLVCSVPPSGNSGLVWRYLFSKPIAAFKVTRSLAAKAFQTSLPLCKETFFSPTMDDHLVQRLVDHNYKVVKISARYVLIITTPTTYQKKTWKTRMIYQKLMTESSRMPLFDLRKLNASLPVPKAKDPSFKVLVLGANDDFIVDKEGLDETGRFYSVSPICVEGIAHDMMLDSSWERGAQAILSWLGNLTT